MKIEIVASRDAGFFNAVYSWGCAMCDSHILRNLDLEYVKRNARNHLISRHNAVVYMDFVVTPVLDSYYSTEVLVIDKDRDGGLDVSFVQMEGAENWVSNYAAEQWPNAIYMLVSIMID